MEIRSLSVPITSEIVTSQALAPSHRPLTRGTFTLWSPLLRRDCSGLRKSVAVRIPGFCDHGVRALGHSERRCDIGCAAGIVVYQAAVDVHLDSRDLGWGLAVSKDVQRCAGHLVLGREQTLRELSEVDRSLPVCRCRSIWFGPIGSSLPELSRAFVITT